MILHKCVHSWVSYSEVGIIRMVYPFFSTLQSPSKLMSRGFFSGVAWWLSAEHWFHGSGFFCTDVVLDNGTKQCLDVFPLVLLVQQLIETTAQNACSEQRASCTFYLILKWSLPPIVLINGLYVPKLNFCS